MATKLNSSLRNSVDAEKKAVDTKPLTVKAVMDNKKPQASKPATPTKAAAKPVAAKVNVVKTITTAPLKAATTATAKKTATKAKPAARPTTKAKPASKPVAKAKPVAKPIAKKPATKVVTKKPAMPKNKPTTEAKSSTSANGAKTANNLNQTMSNAKAGALLNNFNLQSLQGTLEKVANINNSLTNSVLENLLAVSEDISSYVQKLSKVSSLSNLYQINMDFYATLRKRHQDLLGKNVDFLNELQVKKAK